MSTDTVRVYRFYATNPTTGVSYTDELMVDHTTRRAWFTYHDKLAIEAPRKNAARWLSMRRDAPNTALFPGKLWRSRASTIPHMPVDAYDEAGKIVLHGDGLAAHGRRRHGETTGGEQFREFRIDADGYDDFHGHTKSDCPDREHHLTCANCGDQLWDFTPDCPEIVWPDCSECMSVYECMSGNCDCITRIEACAECGKQLGDGDCAWENMDGGEVYCPDHIVFDERPDSLFKRVGALRGEALPAFAWPGGYTLEYYTRDGATICADCATKVEISDPAASASADGEQDCAACSHAAMDHAWLGPCETNTQCGCAQYMLPLCDDCGKPIDPAFRNKEVKA